MIKRQELDQLRQKNKTELLDDLKSAQKELVELRLSRAQNRITNVHQLLALKRRIAQLSTLVSAKKA